MAIMGRKDDGGKRRWSLIPWTELGLVVDVLTQGAVKYSAGNWQHVDGARARYADATMRHFAAWMGGERLDGESGMPHLAHVACNVLFLMWFDRKDGSA